MQAGVERGARLVWLPTGALGILPVGIAQDPATRHRLVDRYEIVYVPSLETAASARKAIAASAEERACDGGRQSHRRPRVFRERG